MHCPLGGKRKKHKLQQSGCVIKHILYLCCASCSNAEIGSATREGNIFCTRQETKKEQARFSSRKMLFGFVIFFCIAGDLFCAGKNIEYKVNNPLKRTSKFIKPNGKIIFYSWPQKWHGSSRTNYIHIHLSLIYEFSRMYDASNPIKKLSLQLSAWSCILLSFKTLPTIPAALYVLEVRFILQRSHSRCLHRDFYWNCE